MSRRNRVLTKMRTHYFNPKIYSLSRAICSRSSPPWRTCVRRGFFRAARRAADGPYSSPLEIENMGLQTPFDTSDRGVAPQVRHRIVSPSPDLGPRTVNPVVGRDRLRNGQVGRRKTQLTPQPASVLQRPRSESVPSDFFSQFATSRNCEKNSLAKTRITV